MFEHLFLNNKKLNFLHQGANRKLDVRGYNFIEKPKVLMFPSHFRETIISKIVQCCSFVSMKKIIFLRNDRCDFSKHGLPKKPPVCERHSKFYSSRSDSCCRILTVQIFQKIFYIDIVSSFNFYFSVTSSSISSIRSLTGNTALMDKYSSR